MSTITLMLIVAAMQIERVVMVSKLDNALGFHQTALRIRANRQELIAANIANADTPNYKARDIDFKAALNNAMTGASAATKGDMVKTSPLHLSGNAMASGQMAALPGEPQYRKMIQGSVDGNTVDMDVERNQFIDNAVRYEASLTMLNGQLKKLMVAIQGQ